MVLFWHHAPTCRGLVALGFETLSSSHDAMVKPSTPVVIVCRPATGHRGGVCLSKAKTAVDLGSLSNWRVHANCICDYLASWQRDRESRHKLSRLAGSGRPHLTRSACAAAAGPSLCIDSVAAKRRSPIHLQARPCLNASGRARVSDWGRVAPQPVAAFAGRIRQTSPGQTRPCCCCGAIAVHR